MANSVVPEQQTLSGLQLKRWLKASDPAAYKGCIIFLLILYQLSCLGLKHCRKKMEDGSVHVWWLVRRGEARVVAVSERTRAVLTISFLVQLLILLCGDVHFYSSHVFSPFFERQFCSDTLWIRWLHPFQFQGCMAILLSYLIYVTTHLWTYIQQCFGADHSSVCHIQLQSSGDHQLSFQIKLVKSPPLKCCILLMRNCSSSPPETQWKRMKRRVGEIVSSACDQLCFHKEGTAVRLGVMIVFVTQMLLMMAGDIEPNPGPEHLGPNDLADVLDTLFSLRDKWYLVGLQLKISYPTLDAIKRDKNNDTTDCFTEMLKKWLTDTSPPATWCGLVQALLSKSVGEKKLAEDIRMEYCDYNEDQAPDSESKSATSSGRGRGKKRQREKCMEPAKIEEGSATSSNGGKGEKRQREMCIEPVKDGEAMRNGGREKRRKTEYPSEDCGRSGWQVEDSAAHPPFHSLDGNVPQTEMSTVAAKWEFIGKTLGFSTRELQDIANTPANHGPVECLIDLLRQGLSRALNQRQATTKNTTDVPRSQSVGEDMVQDVKVFHKSRMQDKSNGPFGWQQRVLIQQPSAPSFMLKNEDRNQMTTPTGEYDFVQKPSIAMKCPVIGNVLTDPHHTDCCGRHLSREAVDKLQSEGGGCWLCNEPRLTTRPDQYYRHKVHEQKVYCPNRKRGCKWEGELSTVHCHVESCPKDENNLAQHNQSMPQKREVEAGERVEEAMQTGLAEVVEKECLTCQRNSSGQWSERDERKTTHLTHYANYLKAVYTKCPVAIDKDRWPPTPSTTYVRLALIKKEKVSRGEANLFTRLTFHGHVDQILKDKQPIRMEDVLKEDDIHARLTLLEGAPGIGKSTFVWELCRQWPILEPLKRFSLVVLLRLREEGVQTATTIGDLLYHHDMELCKRVGEEVDRKEGEGLLLLFDGFDEFPAHLRKKSLVKDVICGAYLPNATVLVTSRPSASAELLSVCHAHVGKHIEVVGFSKKEIQEYAESVFGSTSELLVSFEKYLSVNPVVKGMMYNPLNCGMVMEMYRQSSLPDRPIPHTQTQLYTELSLCLLSRHLSAARDPLARRLPNWLENIPQESELYKQLLEIGKLAFEGRVKEEVIFKQLPKDSSTLGLMNSCCELYGRKEDKTYNFLHLTLQEYLGAFYISQLTASEQRRLFVKHRKARYLNVIWRFVAGLTKMQAIGWEEFKETEMVEEVRMLGNVDSVYQVGNGVVRVTPSIVQCLYEAQDAESCRIVFGRSSVEYCGQRCSTPFDAFAVGCCVSLCDNVWNVDMTLSDLGPDVVEMLVCGLKSIEKTGGSVKKLLLSRNPIKDEGMKYFRELPLHTLQNIKTLDISDCGLCKTGFDLLADILSSLLSLKSLDISLNPGGHGSTVELLKALGKHQTVKCLGMKYTGIGMADVLALCEVVQPSGSLRELAIGRYRMSAECAQQLVRTVLSTSSLRVLSVWIPSSLSLLNCIETISDSLTELTFQSEGAHIEQLPTEFDGRGGIMLSNILKKNTTLKKLVLRIPMESIDVRAIVDSLKHNYTLKNLGLSTTCSSNLESQCVSGVEQHVLDNRIV